MRIGSKRLPPPAAAPAAAATAVSSSSSSSSSSGSWPRGAAGIVRRPRVGCMGRDPPEGRPGMSQSSRRRCRDRPTAGWRPCGEEWPGWSGEAALRPWLRTLSAPTCPSWRSALLRGRGRPLLHLPPEQEQQQEQQQEARGWHTRLRYARRWIRIGQSLRRPPTRRPASSRSPTWLGLGERGRARTTTATRCQATPHGSPRSLTSSSYRKA